MTAYEQRALDCLREFVAFEQQRMEDELIDCSYRSIMIGGIEHLVLGLEGKKPEPLS